MHKCKLVTAHGALDYARNRLCCRVGTLRLAWLADLGVAADVTCRYIGTAHRLSFGPIFQYQVPKQTRLAVVSIWSKPFFKLVGSRADGAIC